MPSWLHDGPAGRRDSHHQGTTTINALAANEGQWLNAVVDTSNLTPGIHTAYLALDLFGVVTEVTETNNWGGFTFEVTAATRPDLTVDSITAGASVVRGVDFNFSYFVKNSGTAASGSSWSGFRIDQQPDQSNAVGYNQTNGLSVGGYQNLSNSFSTANSASAPTTLYVMADYWGAAGHRDRRNQQCEVDHLHGDRAAGHGPDGEEPHPRDDGGAAGRMDRLPPT